MEDFHKIYIKLSPPTGTALIGRNQGQFLRQLFNLDKIDRSNNEVVFVISNETSAITPSFFKGLCYNSILNLGNLKFQKKYKFETEVNMPTIKEAITHEIEFYERWESLEPFTPELEKTRFQKIKNAMSNIFSK